MHYPEQVDGLLARRTVLNRLDNETFLQWMGYGLGRDWPLGLRDFLVVTSEECINDFQDGFVIASTSVDQICEEIDDIDNSVEEIMGKDSCGRTFQRASITISGFVGLPDGNGGTNLTLFIDSDGYEHTPSWLLRLLAQYELCEVMNRIRALPSSLSIPVLQANDHNHGNNNNSNNTALSSSSMNAGRNDPIANSVDKAEITLTASSSSTSSVLSLTHTTQTIYQHSDEFYVTEGLELAAKSIHLMKDYLGFLQSAPVRSSADESSSSVSLDWQVRVRKDNMIVSSATVPGSQWQAICAVKTIAADKNVILSLLLDDNRMNEIDDMVDFVVPLIKVDARTSVRRVCCKPVWPTAPRDFIVCTTWTELADGSVMVCSRSAPNDVLSTQRGYVRGFINIRYVFIRCITC